VGRGIVPCLRTLLPCASLSTPGDATWPTAWAIGFLWIRITSHALCDSKETQYTVCCVQQLPCSSVRVCVCACLGACMLHSASSWGLVAAATPACVEAGLACVRACVRPCVRACVRVCVCAHTAVYAGACVRACASCARACVHAPPVHEHAPLRACTLQPGSPWSAACAWLQHPCACESLARVHASAPVHERASEPGHTNRVTRSSESRLVPSFVTCNDVLPLPPMLQGRLWG